MNRWTRWQVEGLGFEDLEAAHQYWKRRAEKKRRLTSRLVAAYMVIMCEREFARRAERDMEQVRSDAP